MSKWMPITVIALFLFALVLIAQRTQNPIDPGSRCYKSEWRTERIGTDGRTYECERVGIFGNHRWTLED